MKKVTILLLTIILILTSSSIGCRAKQPTISTPSPPVSSYTPTPTPTPIPTVEKIPIWQESDTEYEKLKGQTEFLVYDVERSKRPPFYNGPIPLKFESAERRRAPNDVQAIAHKFDGFANFFIYQDHVVFIGARTYGPGNELLAEMRLRYFVKGNTQGIEAEEFHYKGGQLVFTCKSEFDFYSGEKISEKDMTGKKTTDYYFILPLGY